MPALTEFVARLAGSPELQSALLEQARARTLRHLHRRFPHARSATLEDAWSDTLADLVQDRVTGFACDDPPDSPAFMASLASYLAYRVAPLKALHLLRAERRERLASELDELPDGADADAPGLLERLMERAHAGAPAHGDWTRDHVLQKQVLGLLHRCIDGLSDALKPVVHAVLHERSHEQTREALGLASVGTVKSRLFAAMGDLRRCMGRHLPHGGPRADDPPSAACGHSPA